MGDVPEGARVACIHEGALCLVRRLWCGGMEVAELGWFGEAQARRMVVWPAVVAVRRRTVPAGPVKVPRCIRSSGHHATPSARS
jgi:hypothetical protein